MRNWVSYTFRRPTLTYAIDAIRFFETPSFQLASGVGLELDVLTVAGFAIVAVQASAYIFKDPQGTKPIVGTLA